MSFRGRSGFTLIELMITLLLFAALAVTTAYLFRAGLLVWAGQEKRAGIQVELDRGIEEMARDLRKSRQVQSTANYNEIRFRQGTATSTYYIFYLYHASDSYVPPPAFNQASYQLRRAALTGGLSGTFTYGAGDIIMNNVVPPPTSALSLSGNLLTIDLTVKRSDETIRTKTQIRPRNCGFTGEAAC